MWLLLIFCALCALISWVAVRGGSERPASSDLDMETGDTDRWP